MENIDTSDVHGPFVPDVSEDSVDIYDGLDCSPSSHSEKPPPNASQLKESLDLYEEIVTEEQQNRESTYSELKTRFQAAQNQIKELHRRLEQMEVQNTGLNTENYRLKKNISALLQTARLELTRKDAEIQRLNQQSEKGRHQHQSHINKQSRYMMSGSSTRPPPPTPCPPIPPPPRSPPPLAPPLPASPPREHHLPQDVETRASKASSQSHSKSSSKGDCDVPDKQAASRKSSSFSSTQHSDSDKNKHRHREEKCQKSESTDRRHKTGSDPNKDCHAPEKSRSHKSDRGPARRYDPRSCKSSKSRTVESRHRSERDKSPPPNLKSTASSDDKKCQEDKVSGHNSAHASEESNGRNRKIKSSDRHIRNSDSKDREKSFSNQHAQCNRDSSKERKGDRLSKDHQIKEERRREEISRKHRRSISSDRERDKLRSKELNQGKVHDCSKERREKRQKAFKRSNEEPNTAEKGSEEENSPNRKLCFMEILNLTLSPIKKPGLPVDGSRDVLPPVDKVVENRPDEDDNTRSQPNIEDMCVIDEVDNSELEADVEETGAPAPCGSLVYQCDGVKEDQGMDSNKSGTTVKQPEDYPAQTTSALSQPPDNAENPVAVRPTHTLPESSSKRHKDKSKLASECQVEESGPLLGKDDVSDTPGRTQQHASSSIQEVNPGNTTDATDAGSKATVLDSSVHWKNQGPKTAVQKSLPVNVKEGAAPSPSRKNCVAEDALDKENVQSEHISPTSLPQDCRQTECPPASTSICDKDTDAVSSTISLESLPREGLSLPEAIYILTLSSEDANVSSSITPESSSSAGCIAVSKVSSTTEEVALPVKYADLTFTPKKSFSPGKSHEKKFEPSSSVPLLHDEDSMMRTLSNLKRIPDAISPLRSPIKITKRSHLLVHGKPGHVKSLERDFSSTAGDANSKKLDVNKENKHPGSPANQDMQNLGDEVSDLPSSLSDTELEEGEILSESDEAPAGSTVPAAKRTKLARPVRNKPFPNRTKEGCSASKETNEMAAISTPSPKSRFKTVCPSATKASFSTIEEVMNTFKLVRTEIRKKYMKLHKTFPKKSFYGVMNNFRESFFEFVDGAHFGEISSQPEELKSKLKKLVTSVFGKLSNNGIVRRIFEQQAVDLKQKLWDFVDGQIDYMFRDIYTTFKNSCKPSRAQAEDNKPSGNEKVSRQCPATKSQGQQKEAPSAPTNLSRLNPRTVVPYKTGLGSRGKDIRITHVENFPNTQTVVNCLPTKRIPSTPDKNSTSSFIISQNGPLLDKTDFELLTEQQASSLTFNLVRDTQMGEIFKCLLQGSDLMETSGITGDSTTWSLGTPRKDGERFISITTPSKFDSPSKLLSPSKFDTPSKLITTWSSISPRKVSSPRSKDQRPLNPALFDESCLLEVPSENRVMLQSNLGLQRSYSILAEDLAVSLTIPSPLKSDSHLSFLQPSSMNIMSTPDSVISAHISEDALLDGEDAIEQDIHLALDTDNSSCASSSSMASEVLATPFVFKPDLPMQALVMEKSNDHFIVRIRQTGADTTLTVDESLSRTLTEDQHDSADGVQIQESGEQNRSPPNTTPSDNNLSNLPECSRVGVATNPVIRLPQDGSLRLTKDSPHKKEDKSHQCNASKRFPEDSGKLSEPHEKLPETTSTENNLQNNPQSSAKSFGQMNQTTTMESSTDTSNTIQRQKCHTEESMTIQQSPSKAHLPISDNGPHHSAESSGTSQSSQVLVEHDSDSETSSTTATEKDQQDCGKGSKRKKHQEKSKSKRRRKEEEESVEEMLPEFRNDDGESKSSPSSLSSSSLYAKNVIRKKGEVVMAWTRDEDRAILITLKKKGASRETFSALAEKLNKPSGQIAHRFYQLMKLYKKQEKMDP